MNKRRRIIGINSFLNFIFVSDFGNHTISSNKSVDIVIIFGLEEIHLYFFIFHFFVFNT